MGPKKNQKMSIGAFLTDESLGSWADEMEDMPLPSSDSRTSYGNDRRAFSSNPGAGSGYARTEGYSVREELPLPTQPPYTAHLGNLSFETSQAQVTDHFRECEVSNVRIVEDKMDRKPKGFGYVEFATVEGLKKALTLNGSSLDGRGIRVSVADPPKDRQDTRDYSDWSRRGPLPDLPGSGGQRRVSERPAFQGRSFDNMSDAGSERGGSRRGPFEQGDGKIRDFSNWERKGPLSPAISAAPSLRDGGRQNSRDSPQFRRSSPAWGEGRSQEGSRPPRREFTEKPVVERAPTASEMDSKWRDRMRPDAPAKSPTPETSAPPSPAPAVAALPTTRPKLNLQKRTVSEADPTSPAATADSKASPFGAARPVDTLAREKEIEEKRQLAIRQKKEADDKARAEKAEEKRFAKEKADAEKAKEPESKAETKEVKESGETKENGSEAEKPTPKFELLRRAASGDNDMVADEDAEEAEDTTAAIVEDKAVKPKEIIRDAPSSKANGAWRNNRRESGKDKKPAASAESTTATLEDDGWSTVTSAKQNKNRRGGNPPARAIAS